MQLCGRAASADRSSLIWNCLTQAKLDRAKPGVLLHSLSHFYRFLPGRPAASVCQACGRQEPMTRSLQKQAPLRLERPEYEKLRQRVLRRDGWQCQFCGSRLSWKSITKTSAATLAKIRKKISLLYARTATRLCIGTVRAYFNGSSEGSNPPLRHS